MNKSVLQNTQCFWFQNFFRYEVLMIYGIPKKMKSTITDCFDWPCWKYSELLSSYKRIFTCRNGQLASNSFAIHRSQLYFTLTTLGTTNAHKTTRPYIHGEKLLRIQVRLVFDIILQFDELSRRVYHEKKLGHAGCVILYLACTEKPTKLKWTKDR